MKKRMVMATLVTASCLTPIALLSVQQLKVSPVNKKACEYAGNMHPANGAMQLELLKREGLESHHYVYEVGCGALMAGIPIMDYLQKGHYVAVEPNPWQIEATMSIAENRAVVERSEPQFFYNEEFDVAGCGVKFDYILAHSIMSHAPLWQLQLFFEKCSKVLNDGGKVIFSIRLTEPNPFSDLSTQPESTTREWQYPGNTFFKKSTVEREALRWFSSVELKPEFTGVIVSADRTAFHDWFVLTK